MLLRPTVAQLVVALAVAGCAAGGAPTPFPSVVPTASVDLPASPDAAEPPDQAGPIDDLMAYAKQHADEFAGLFIDPPGSNRIVMLFTANLEQHATAVQAISPGVRVVAARFTEAELIQLLESAMTALLEVPGVELIAGSVDTPRNIVTIEVKSDDPTLEVRTELQYAGRVDLVVHPVPGPWANAASGDGWRLLGSGTGGFGEAYTVRAATDASSSQDLWAASGIAGAAPAVDFDNEVVVSFGHGIGSGCPELRLDGVEVTDGTVFSVVSDPLEPRACAADLVGAAVFVVAVERAALPDDGFTLQLTEDTRTCADCGFTERIEVELP
jgi:hypothetical protein